MVLAAGVQSVLTVAAGVVEQQGVHAYFAGCLCAMGVHTCSTTGQLVVI